MEIFRSQGQIVLPSQDGSLAEKDVYYTAMMSALLNHGALLTDALNQLTGQAANLAAMAQFLVGVLRSGNKVLVAGNGGSAAEAQHFAAELVGRFKRERRSYPVLALTTDTAILTAVANDYGYQDVFARQVLAFGQADDLLTVFSTSGESENLIRAACAARERAMTVTAIVSERACRLAQMAHLAIQVPALDTTAIQELHLVVMHLLCEIVEERLASEEKESHA